jgi:hypothetical protein
VSSPWHPSIAAQHRRLSTQRPQQHQQRGCEATQNPKIAITAARPNGRPAALHGAHWLRAVRSKEVISPTSTAVAAHFATKAEADERAQEERR